MLPGSAMATIIITTGVSNTGTNNVLFNIGGLANDALTVQGVVNNAANTLVDFTSPQTLHGSGGQARVEGINSTTYDNFAVQIHSGESFTKLVWNLNTSSGSGTVIFTIDGVAYDGPDADTLPDAFTIGNGSNFFTIEASGGSALGIVSYQTTGVTIQDTRQIRIGGVGTTGGGDVPEPATLFTAGLALFCFSLIRKCI